MPPQNPAPEHFQEKNLPLPTPRALLTSLLSSLATSPPQPKPTADANPNSKSKSKATSLPTTTDSPPNPLKSLPASQKTLLATLHVLFPPPTLLQALDLLDRGLVTRVHVSPSSQQQGVDSSTSASGPEHAHEDVPRDSEREVFPCPRMAQGGSKNIFYRVRSAQSQSRSRYHASPAGNAEIPAGGLVYTVRLRAWNCDCAAFAFAAFPPFYPSLDSGGEIGRAHV